MSVNDNQKPCSNLSYDQKEVKKRAPLDQENIATFNEVFKSEHKYLYNLLYQLTGDRAWAEDLVQETFVLALEKLSGFRQASSFRTWLTRIAINLFRNEYRRRSRQLSLDVGGVHHRDPSASLEETIIKSELQWCIMHNLRYHVPKSYREVLVLRDLQNFSYQEISETLSLPLNLVKVRLHRARKLFREQFIRGRCRAFTDHYLCICEGILDLSQLPRKRKMS